MKIFSRGNAKRTREISKEDEGLLRKHLETARAYWSKVAKDNGWYDPKKPFYVQIWVNRRTFEMRDSIYATKEARDDSVVFESARD